MDQRARTIKLLNENIRENLHDLGFRNGFLDITTKEYSTKEKTDELCSSKLKTFVYHSILSLK